MYRGIVLQVFKQRSDGYAGSAKKPCPADRGGMLFSSRTGRPINHASNGTPGSNIWPCAEPALHPRHGPAAHTVAAVLRRLPCGARACGLAQNSLCSLRSRRSNNCAKSDHKAIAGQSLAANPTLLSATACATGPWWGCRAAACTDSRSRIAHLEN